MLDKWWLVVVIISVAVSVITTILVLIRNLSKKYKERLAMVAAALGAEFFPGSWKEQPSMKLGIGSRSCEITFHVVSSGNSSVTYLDLKADIAPTDTKISIKKVGFGSKFFKRIGLSKPISSGDPYFDEKVAVFGSPEQRILSLIYGPYFKDAAMKLSKRGYTVSTKDDKIIASKVFSRKKDLTELVLREDLDALVRLAETLEERR